MFSGKTGCNIGFRVNQYKSLCAFSLSLISLNSVLIFVNWYKQLIVFLVLCFLLCVLAKSISKSSDSRSKFILGLKVFKNPL